MSSLTVHKRTFERVYHGSQRVRIARGVCALESETFAFGTKRVVFALEPSVFIRVRPQQRLSFRDAAYDVGCVVDGIRMSTPTRMSSAITR